MTVMRLAYLDCFSGISGDMFLGALVDAGVSLELLRGTVATLNLGAELEMTRVERSGIAANKIDVVVNGEKDLPREEYWAQQEHSHQHGHGHEGHEDRQHGHSHPEAHSHGPEHHGGHGRGLSEIRSIIGVARISERAKHTAIAIFEALGAAEAKIHNTDVEQIHFHEVGAVDALVDIICAAVGAEALGVDEWVCSPLNVGGGAVECAHGRFPIPAPATLEILQGAPIYSSGIDKELVTPTGAAIAKVLASRFASFPAMMVDAVGYGAGSRDLPGHANVLRISVGESTEITGKLPREMLSVIEANLDDLSPQVIAYTMEKALAEGALDAFAAPVQMKKSRCGVLLTILARPEDVAHLTRLLFAETTTLGVRVREERRQVLDRSFCVVETRWGGVRMKLATLNGEEVNYAPEFEDCRRIAEQNGVPLKAVMQEAVQKYLARSDDTESPPAAQVSAQTTGANPSTSSGQVLGHRTGP